MPAVSAVRGSVDRPYFVTMWRGVDAPCLQHPATVQPFFPCESKGGEEMQTCQSVNASVLRLSCWRFPTLIAVAVTALLAVTLCSDSVRGQTLPGGESQIRTSDLIRLATSSSDALGELKIARLKLDTLRLLS